jgi:putative phosphoribosyl transferase
MFQNRTHAGKLLAAKLRQYQNMPGILLAVPRGGVPVAFEVAKELHMPLEVMLVKKLGHPSNKEYAIGAVGLEDSFVIPHEGVTDYYIQTQTEKIRARLQEMKEKFMGDDEPTDLRGKTVIVIDDGIATGNTLIATIRILKKSEPLKIIVATPVVSRSAAEKIRAEVDDLVAVLVPQTFYGVGMFYNDFTQVSDEEVLRCLKNLRQFTKA